MDPFTAAVVDGNYAAALRCLDGAIGAAQGSGDPSLAPLLVNRGACNQRLQLYRKALKVQIVPQIDLSMA
jgi:hypothetical protein